MFRVIKSLNNNGVLAFNMDNSREYILIGKGVGFGKKVNERIEAPEDTQIYALQKDTERGPSREIINSVSPEILEISNLIIIEAEKHFKNIDRNILCPLADHIWFAIKRIKNKQEISNPLTQDIRALFPEEYNVALKGREIIGDAQKVYISDDEVGYIALHIHSALGDEKVSQAMETARIVRQCINMIEESTGEIIDVDSLSYNRLMSHIKYMAARTIKGETIKLDMNDYIGNRFPKAFDISKQICSKLERQLKSKVQDVEIGYLAMHIARIFSEEN